MGNRRLLKGTNFCWMIIIGLAFTSVVSAQQGHSSGAVSISRSNVNANASHKVIIIEDTNNTNNTNNNYYSSPARQLSSKEIVVEEFVNYHKHNLPLPKAGDAVALDLRWGSEYLSTNQGLAVLQVGFTTAEVHDQQHLPPVNLAIVIDHSGSMASDNKLERVKQAVTTLIGQLRAQDTLSLIVYDDAAQVLFPAQHMTNESKQQACHYIAGIYPGSATNLHDGLILGYKEAQKNFSKEASNRVILLTDGIANVGVVEPEQIAKDSVRFNDQGIDLSTIGVGNDLNQDLLRTLAKSGRGLFHFVADGSDIEKVFVKEVQSLVATVARQAQVEIEYDSALTPVKIYGYQVAYQPGKVIINLDDMNQGLTQVIMMKFALKREVSSNKRENPYLSVKASLYYHDVQKHREVVRSEQTSLAIRNGEGDLLQDNEVKKNFTIAELAQALHDGAVANETRQPQQCQSIVQAAVNRAYERYPNRTDKDINYILDIVEQYQPVTRRSRD